jgi:hypothetical protein
MNTDWIYNKQIAVQIGTGDLVTVIDSARGVFSD